jgi:hypothetical protein
MSGKLIFVLVALGTFSSAAVGLGVAQSDFGRSVFNQTYPTKADFDRTFAAFVTASTFDPESLAAQREKLRAAGLRRMNLTQFSEQ